MDRKKLALIHIIKKELNLSDAEYRDILRNACGVNSAKELDEGKFKKLMRYFVRSKYYRVNSHGLTLRQKLYIQSLAQKLEWLPEHLRNFTHKYYHKSDMTQLTKEEASRLIESLKNIRVHASIKDEGLR
ncbi:MAG: DUF1018 domain-containing protein [Candidatus Omnitrophota bacterium]|nr:DUF1018 domain-containing protein [Candidatus Omnitrophota bacterium]